jgi:hypothetical protein
MARREYGAVLASVIRRFERMTVIAERRLEHLLKGLPPDRQAEILAALHNEIAQERQRRVESDALRALGAAVAAKDRLTDGALEFLAHLARIVRARGCAVALAEPDGRFRVVASRGFTDPSLPSTEPFENLLTERLVRGRVPMLLPDVNLVRHGRAVSARVTGWALPVLVDDEIRGFVTIRRDQADPFTHDQLRLAQGAVTAAAPGLALLQRLEQMRGVNGCAIEGSSRDAGESAVRGRPSPRLRRVPAKPERGRQSGVLRRHDGPHP